MAGMLDAVMTVPASRPRKLVARVGEHVALESNAVMMAATPKTIRVA